MYKLIKNKVFAGALIAVTLFTASCKKTLDVAPFTSFSDQTAFSSPLRIEAAMNGVYDAAQSGFYAGGQVRGYPFGSANIIQSDMRGEDMLNQALFYQITYEATYNSVSANQEFMFNTLYGLINKANLMIDGVTGAVANNVIPAERGNQYIGEARFLRALAHHELLLNFARPFADGAGSKLGIIYRETASNTPAQAEEAKSLKRTTVASNYAKLLEDLNFAETNLAATTLNYTDVSPAISIPRTFRATKGAAIALKTRVKLHMQDWAGVIAEGNKMIPAAAPFVSPIGGWALTPNPGDPFVLPGTSVENIFSIRNASSDNPGVNGALPNMLGSTAIGGRALVAVSPIAYNLPEWKCDDKRRNLLVLSGGVYLTTKYKDPATGTDPAPQIRYAEVLLNVAEAEARLNPLSLRALALLNAVRNRSLASPATEQYTIANFSAPNSLVLAIHAERRIEFLAEGKRWYDIHRLAADPVSPINGIPAKIGTGASTPSMYSCGAGSSTYTTAIAAIPYADRRFILPIPLSETQQNPNFEQNPEY